MRLLTIIAITGFCLIAPLRAGAQPEQNNAAEQILRLALANNPSIKSTLATISMAEGNALQASLRRNPNAVMEFENFAGEREFSGFDGAEITLGLEQPIETAGKRKHRTAVARFGLSMAEQEAVAKILGTLAEVQFAATQLVVAQERLDLAVKRLELANQTHETVKKRVSAAAASDIQHTKVDIELKAAEIAKQKAEKELQTTTAQLARLVGMDPIPQIGKIDLDTFPTLPSQAGLLIAIENMPQSKILEFNQQRAHSAINLARAESVPNVTVGLGVRRFNNRDDNALIATLSVPIPLFDRNQGGVAKARAEARKADADSQAGLLALKETVLTVWEQFDTSRGEVAIYQKDIIPSARKAYQQASEGYASGRYSFLELLDAQRTLYEVQDSFLESLLDLHQAKAQTDYLLNLHEPLLTNYLNIGEIQ